MENDLIIQKIIIENHKLVIETDNYSIPTLREIREEILYNLSAKCYDMIYGIDERFFRDDTIKDVLIKNRLMFMCEGELLNCTQVSLF